MNKIKLARQIFANTYFRTGNATQSAIAAGYSKRSAGVTGSRLLKNASVQAYLEWLTRKSMGDLAATIEERKAMLTKLATQIVGADPIDFLNADGTVNIDENAPNRLAIASVKSRKSVSPNGSEETTSDIRFRDPNAAIKAIDVLNRMDGLYQDDDRMTGVTVQLLVQRPDGQMETLVDGTSRRVEPSQTVEIEASETENQT